jgi:hypothetical protein
MSVDQVNQAASQEMAVAGNQALVHNILDRFYKTENEKENSSKVKPEEMISQAIKGKNIAKAGMDMLRNFLGRASQAGIMLNSQAISKNVKNQLSKEIDDLFAKEDFKEDLVSISRGSKRSLEQKIKGISLNAERDGGSDPQSGNGDKAEFVSLCSQYLLSNDPKIKKQLDAVAEKLQEAGMSKEQLQNLQSSVRSSTRAEIQEQIKEGLKLYMLSPRKGIEGIGHMRGISDFVRGALTSKNLFMGENDAFGQQIVDEAAENASRELKPFLLEQLENLFIKKTLTQDTDYADVYKMLDTCAKAKVDVDYYIEKVWQNRKEDLGLFSMEAPPQTAGATVNTSTDNPQNQARHGYEFTREDEKEIQLGRLRALYMQKALHGGIKGLITNFKILRTKAGYKLGILTKEMDEQLQHEGKIAAKMKVIEIIKEGLLERASLYELAGPAFKLNERKIKTALANAERLGIPISQQEFVAMRDTADRRMYEIAERELETVEGYLAHTKNPLAEKKQKLLIKLMKRLAEEANIQESRNSDTSFC